MALDVFFQAPDAPKPVFGRGSAPDPCGGAYNPPPDSYSAVESWNTHIMGTSARRRRPKQGKYVLDLIPPGISWKFAWLNL